ncbi:MAG: DUF2807 domain-containing protein [Microscillaceae bacterium]|nr:DUF2807 domain-containing protein [Microscillaceae bacterium]
MAGCVDDFTCQKANGPLETQDRSASNFSRISHLIDGQVFIRQGASYQVQVTARESIINAISTQVVNGELRIGLDECIRGDSDIEIQITLPQLNGIELAGSGQVFGESSFTANAMDLRLSGSGSIHLDVNVQNLETNVSGSGRIFLEGNTLTQEVRVSGSGEVEAFDLQSQQAEAIVSGSGNIGVRVGQSLQALISGSGNILYKGTPSVQATISGSGRVLNAN